MRGHIQQRGSGWSVVLDRGRDPLGKRQQVWRTVHGTRADAEQELANLLREFNDEKRLTATPLESGALVDVLWISKHERWQKRSWTENDVEEWIAERFKKSGVHVIQQKRTPNSVIDIMTKASVD